MHVCVRACVCTGFNCLGASLVRRGERARARTGIRRPRRYTRVVVRLTPARACARPAVERRRDLTRDAATATADRRRIIEVLGGVPWTRGSSRPWERARARPLFFYFTDVPSPARILSAIQGVCPGQDGTFGLENSHGLTSSIGRLKKTKTFLTKYNAKKKN